MTSMRFHCTACSAKLSAALELRNEACGCPKCGAKVVPADCPPLDIRFHCASCEAPLLVDQKAGGKMICCPTCGDRQQVPDQSEPRRPRLDPGSARLTEEEIEFLTAS